MTEPTLLPMPDGFNIREYDFIGHLTRFGNGVFSTVKEKNDTNVPTNELLPLPPNLPKTSEQFIENLGRYGHGLDGKGFKKIPYNETKKQIDDLIEELSDRGEPYQDFLLRCLKFIKREPFFRMG
jgi:hypothetical protein